MPRALAVAAVVAALGAVVAAPAGANTLSYNGTTSTTDVVNPVVPFDQSGPTSCSSSPDLAIGDGPVPFRAYAFRNMSSTTDCLTVSGASDCAQGETFDVSLAPTVFLGSDEANTPACQSTHTHSFNVPSGLSFIEFVFSTGPGFPYTLSVQGSNVAPVRLLSVSDAPLPGGNTVSVDTSSLEDGTAVQGSLTDTAGPGHRYSGPVRCLRVSGRTASMVMTISSSAGLASKWKGAVYWFRESQDGTADAQRNSLLTQAQLDGKYASCPDPTAPLAPGFKTITSQAGPVVVVDNGPQAG